jgi:hypothetical protein
MTMANGEIAQIIHALPRRLRLRAPALAGRRGVCERVASALAREGAFDRVTVRPSTGSVLVEGREGTITADELAARVCELVAAERDEDGRPLTALGPERYPGPTRIAHAVAHAFAGINGDVRAALDHRADLGTLLPVIFAVAGIAEVGLKGRMPVPTWFNLLWWSVRSFMTFNVSAVEEEAKAEEPPER